jgi:hypothetical protein
MKLTFCLHFVFNQRVTQLFFVPGHALLWLSPIPSHPIPSHTVPSRPGPSHPVYKSTCVFECKVVSQLQRNRWRTFGDCFRLHCFLARYRCPYICKSTCVFEFNVVSKFESNRWTFGDCFRLHRFLARYGCRVYTETWPRWKWRSCQISRAIGEQRSEVG